MDTQSRVCGTCGERDPRWHGKDAAGWQLDAAGAWQCPSCAWALDTDRAEAQDDQRGEADR